jgi:hypothetical protein
MQQITNVTPMPSAMSALGQHQDYLYAQGPANFQPAAGLNFSHQQQQDAPGNYAEAVYFSPGEGCDDFGQQNFLHELIYKQTASGMATQSSIERAYSDLLSSNYPTVYEKPHSCSPSPVQGVLKNLGAGPLEDEHPMPMDSCKEPGSSMDLLELNQLQELNNYFHPPGVEDPVTVNALMAGDGYYSRYLTIQRLDPELAKAFGTLLERSRGLYAEAALVAALAEMLKIFGREHLAARDAHV